MDVILRKYSWVSTLLTLAICAFFAAKAAGEFALGAVPLSAATGGVSGRLGGSDQRLGARGNDRGGVRPDVKRGFKATVMRNIFCSTCPPLTVDGALPSVSSLGDLTGGEQNGEAVKSSSNLVLIATLVSPEDSAWSLAALHNPDEQQTQMVREGSSLPGGGSISEVLEKRVLLLRNGQAEYIDLASAETPGAPATQKTRASSAKPSAGLGDFSGSVRKIGANKWEIQRSALNKVLTNTTLLARSARIVPSMKNGKSEGFKLYAIRPGSIYSLIGMQNGDTINAINGRPMTSPDRALEVYTKVRSASHLSISFTRRGTPTTHDYVIR